MTVELAPYVGSEALERARAGHDTLAAGRTGRGADRDRIIARRVTIVELHFQGYSERQIADVVGVGKSQVHREIVMARTEWHERMMAAVEAHSAEAVAVLDLARARIMRAFLAPELKIEDLARLHAELMRNEERRARTLGTNAPDKVEVFSVDALDAEINRLAAELDGAGETGIPAEAR